ncbi:MAG: M3 family metallopeptidase [Bacteroidales bacterium]
MKFTTLLAITCIPLSLTLQAKETPFSKAWDKQVYNIPPFNEIKTEDFMPAFKQAFKEQNAEIDNIISTRDIPSFENTVLTLDQSGSALRKVIAVFSNISAANSTPELRELGTEIIPMISTHFDNIYMNPYLFRRIKRIKEQGEYQTWAAEKKRLFTETYKKFINNGAELSSVNRDSLKKINERISLLQLQFEQNVLAETASFTLSIDDSQKLKGIPSDYIMSASQRSQKDGVWQFGLDNSSIMPYLQYGPDKETREDLLHAYLNRGNNENEYDNKAIVKELLALRLAKANLLSYPTYADYVLSDRMAKTPQQVYKLLDRIWPYAIQTANDEKKEMRSYMQAHKIKTPFSAADWRFYSNLMKNEKYQFDENAIRAYFSLDQVRLGVFYVCEQLYGLKFTALDSVPTPTPYAKAYACTEADGKFVGIVFLDMFARPGAKSGGAWCDAYVPQGFSKGAKQTPVVTVVCNFPAPNKGEAALLNLDETSTFFHEFGHAIHALLQNVDYNTLADVPRDFVELPSQIMEHWAFEPQVLKVYAKHYQNQEVLPNELMDKIQKSAKHGMGFATTEFLAAAYLDLDYHSQAKYAKKFNLLKFENKTLKHRKLIKEIPPRYRTTYFTHTMSGGYTAGYYGYTWAEVLDADAFEAFKESGNIFDQKTASAFRKNILERGGLCDPMEMYINFRGKEPNPNALLKNRGFIE